MLDARSPGSPERLIMTIIHIAEDLLATMMAPAQSPAQITLHVGYLERMSGLTYRVEMALLLHAGTTSTTQSSKTVAPP